MEPAFGGEGVGARNVILEDADCRALRGAAYRDSDEFGLLIDVLYETGARPSQVVRSPNSARSFSHPISPAALAAYQKAEIAKWWPQGSGNQGRRLIGNLWMA